MADGEPAYLDGGPYERDDTRSTFSHIEEGLVSNPHGLATVAMHQNAEFLSELTAHAKPPATNQNGAHTASGCLQWTYAQLHEAATRFATGLATQGIRPGMRIATLIPNRVEFPLTYWMTSLLKLQISPLDPGAVNPARNGELAKLMASTDPHVVMVLDEKGAKAIDQVFESRPPPTVKIILEGSCQGWTTLLHLAAQGTKSTISRERLVSDARHDEKSRISAVLFTSGTSTGQPKGCPRDVAAVNFNLNHRTSMDPSGFSSRCRTLTASANFRAISCALHHITWQGGGAAVTPDPVLGVKGMIRAIRDFRITHMILIPAQVFGITADPEFADLDTSCAEIICLGGDVVTKDALDRTRKAFPSASVSVAMGMTEGQFYAEWAFHETPPEDIPFFGEIAPLGMVSKGAKVHIRDPETGKTLRRNDKGELCVSSDAFLRRYLDDVSPTTFFHSEDGTPWFRTGDLGMINSDGVVFVLGRIKDVIKRSGIPITPSALESCLEKATGSHVSVIAWPHPVLGQEPLAIVQSFNGKTEDDLRDRVLEMFGPDYALGPIVRLEELGLQEFPFNATGKTEKTKVVALLKQHYSALPKA